ncbi:hypothetical protein ACIN8IBEIGE_50134 [Acinetobacter sp. 8I-beige]|nr:hypothetical protein ACIN8IBEIGE_50134 [Acinetobacter sp. 8I-beige]
MGSSPAERTIFLLYSFRSYLKYIKNTVSSSISLSSCPKLSSLYGYLLLFF